MDLVEEAGALCDLLRNAQWALRQSIDERMAAGESDAMLRADRALVERLSAVGFAAWGRYLRRWADSGRGEWWERWIESVNKEAA
jgi:hypothetical protein